MKDEIKEAIDNLNGVVKGIYRMDEAGLEIKDIERLLDYITNLQTIEQQYSAILSENAELENKITNLEEEIKRLNNQYDLMENSLDEKQEIIEKAIEYHNNCIENLELSKINDNEKLAYQVAYEIHKNYLNILQGEDNETR